MSKGMHRNWPPVRKPRRWLGRIVAGLAALTVIGAVQSVNIITAHAATTSTAVHVSQSGAAANLAACAAFRRWNSHSETGAVWRPRYVRAMLRAASAKGVDQYLMRRIAHLVAIMPLNPGGTSSSDFGQAFDAVAYYCYPPDA